MLRVFKEPLLHFLLAGAALFGAYAWINRTAENPNASKAPQIQIGAGGELDHTMATSPDA